MAGHDSSQSCNPQADALDNYLTENGLSRIAPLELDRIQASFSLLQERFSIGVPSTNPSEESEPDIASSEEAAGADPTEAVVTAQTARRNASPLVQVYPVDTFAVGVPSPGDLFRFIAFGTVSVDVYEEIVWEDIQRLPGYQSLETKVYEVNKTDGKLRFEILFQNQAFEFLYFHSEILARSVQQPWSVPGTFRREDHSVEILQAIEEVEESTIKKSLFANSPSHRRAYYAIRALAIIKGLWNEKYSKEIIYALGKTPTDGILDYDAISVTIFGESVMPSKFQPCPEDVYQDWIGSLKTLRSTPIYERINAKSCLIINTMVGGCSNTVIGKWLSLVERRLARLSQLFLTALPKRKQAGSEAFVTLWPYRLTLDSNAGHTDSQAGVYESCFLVGLSFMPNPEERQVIDDVADKWMTSILNHEYTLEGRTIMSTQLLPASNGRLQSLSNCPRIFPRAYLTPPNPLIDDSKETKEESQRLSRKSKGKHSSNANHNTTQISSNHHDTESEPSKLAAGKFPTATQVHNRLKHDTAFNIEEYMIGYKDFDTIAEMPAENWIRETTDEAFVPESRVKYFVKYDRGVKEVIWDRERRINEMFRKKVD